MPIIGKVGRDTWGMRVLNFFIHAILLLGGVTMVFPFLIMISASFKSYVDSSEFTVIPHFFHDRNVLFQKYIEARHNEDSNRLLDQYANRYPSFDFLRLPEPNPGLRKDWMDFLKQNRDQFTSYDFQVSEQFSRGVYPRNQRAFLDVLKDETDDDLDALNRSYGMGVQTWDAVRVEEREIPGRNFAASDQSFLGRYHRFKMRLPDWHRDILNLDGNFVATTLAPPFGNDLDSLNRALGTDFTGWDRILLSPTVPQGPLRLYWLQYVRNTLNVHHIRLRKSALPAYRDFLRDKYGRIDEVNRLYDTQFKDFGEIDLPQELPNSGTVVNDYTFFIETLAQPEDLRVTSPDLRFRAFLQDRYGSVDRLNRAWGLGYDDFSSIPLPVSYPSGNLALRDDWITFYRTAAGDQALFVTPVAAESFRAYLRSRFSTPDGRLDISAVNRSLGTGFGTELDVFPERNLPKDTDYRELWLDFVRTTAPPRFVELSTSAEEGWRSFLENRYGTVDSLNSAWQLRWKDFDEVVADRRQIDAGIFETHLSDIFREFLGRNYIKVLDVMLYSGRAVFNTLIYCGLSILFALVVNPLAAYALSRYQIRFTYQILLVLMLTMAFPAMVMGIPNFLILKKMGLLNTFWALVLPAAADGYFIFLLKGFFDSLPKQVFESASLDGAGEWRLFWQFALLLSKPILAVIALGAFNAAYRNFMFAFIVCPDQNMHTMMVEIYQLMQKSSPGVGYAALVIAAIPTLFVFVAFQRVIIRGIIVPVEK